MRIKYVNELGHHVYTLTFDEDELERIRLTPMDRALLRECEESDSIADMLLGLETIARRIEEYDKDKN